MKRAARAEQRRRERASVCLSVAVPCSHGHEGKHHVRVVLDRSGRVISVSSDCQEARIDEGGKAVMRGLVGEEYRSCLELVNLVQNFLREGTYSTTLALEQYCKDDVYRGALCTLVRSSRRNDRGARTASAEFLRQQIQEGGERRALRGLVLPAGVEGYLKVEGKTISLAMRAEGFGLYHPVGRYRGQGRWKVSRAAIFNLANQVASKSTWDHEGKKPCPFCRSRFRNINSHVKSTRHLAAVEKTVLEACEIVGNNLKRKDWRDHV